MTKSCLWFFKIKRLKFLKRAVFIDGFIDYIDLIKTPQVLLKRLGGKTGFFFFKLLLVGVGVTYSDCTRATKFLSNCSVTVARPVPFAGGPERAALASARI